MNLGHLDGESALSIVIVVVRGQGKDLVAAGGHTQAQQKDMDQRFNHVSAAMVLVSMSIQSNSFFMPQYVYSAIGRNPTYEHRFHDGESI